MYYIHGAEANLLFVMSMFLSNSYNISEILTPKTIMYSVQIDCGAMCHQ